MSLKLQKILKNYFKIWSFFFIFNLFERRERRGKGPPFQSRTTWPSEPDLQWPAARCQSRLLKNLPASCTCGMKKGKESVEQKGWVYIAIRYIHTLYDSYRHTYLYICIMYIWRFEKITIKKVNLCIAFEKRQSVQQNEYWWQFDKTKEN